MRNPNDSSLQAQIDELRQLLRANPLRSASVEKGRTRYYGGSQLLIEDSNLSVTGTAEVFGILRVVGTAIVEGLGRLVVNSLIDLLGSMRVRGGGSITVEDGGDVVVDGGEIRAGDVIIRDGKVYIAAMILDPEVAGGALTFPNGSRLEADDDNSGSRVIAGDAVVNVGDVTSIRKGPSSVIVSDDSVTMNAAGGGDISMIGAVRIPGIPTVSGTGLQPNVLLVTAEGYLRRSDGT